MRRVVTAVGLVWIAVASLASTSCQQAVLCGPGTLEQNGVCVPADNSKDPNAACGAGTYLDPETLVCQSDFEPVVCDPATTVPVTDSNGITTCVGEGSTDCSTPLTCPTPAGGTVAVCGRILDVATGDPIEVDGESSLPCQNPVQGGPCAIGMAFYDAGAFLTDPQNAQPLAVEELLVDECGRFRATGVTPPATLPFMGIGITDHPASGNANYVVSGVAFPAAAGQRLEQTRVYAVDRQTNVEWTTSASAAGPPPALEGMSFAEKGAYMALFRHGDQPVAGVTLIAGNPPAPTDQGQTFYFSDADGPSEIRTVDPAATVTGPNGAVLLLDSPLTIHSGIGSEADGCMWPLAQGASVSGVIFVDEQIMVRSMSEEICPPDAQ